MANNQTETWTTEIAQFVSDLQVGNIIRFKQITWSGGTRDTVIEIVFREEKGIPYGRCAGRGGIQYANVDENFNHKELHKDGYYPMQTFASMMAWHRNSQGYEILKTTSNE